MSPRPERSAGLLVIIPCGIKKIWDKYPDAGPTAAAKAYIGPPFVVNRRYAEQADGDWVVLSAKYGLLRPTDMVPGPYNTTFKRKSSNPIGIAALREQAGRMGLDGYDAVVGLGGKEYRSGVRGYATAADVPVRRAYGRQGDASHKSRNGRAEHLTSGAVEEHRDLPLPAA